MRVRVIADSVEPVNEGISKSYVGRTVRRMHDNEEDMSLTISRISSYVSDGSLGYWVNCVSEMNAEWCATPACYKIEEAA